MPQTRFDSYTIVPLETLKDLKPLHAGSAARARCLPGTRVDILQDLFTSLAYPNADRNIIWLRGPAGSGKSTILNTLAHYSVQLRRLGAFLFWDRNNPDNSEPHRAIHTLAQQLALFHPLFACELDMRMKKWPRVTEYSLDLQFQYLLQEPLTALAATHDLGPIVIILDALDECGTSESRRQLLNTLSAGLAKLPNVFRLLIASRDEPDILDTLSLLNPRSYDLFVGDESTSLDITLFFQTRLANNNDAHVDRRLQPDWPGADVIRRLVTLSGGLFIWASTTIRFIESGPREARLKTILGASEHGPSHAKLDNLYRVALIHSFDSYISNELEYAHSVLGAIVVARVQLTDQQLGQLLGLEMDVVQDVLSRLQPLLQGGRGQPVRFLHASFIEFLCDLEKCQDARWHINTPAHHLDLASRCLKVMQQDVKFNICGVETSYRRNNEIEGIQERVARAITPVLMYASQYWADHLESGSTPKADLHPFVDIVNNFFTHRFLYWIEVFSLKEQMSMIPPILRKMINWAKVCLAFLIRSGNT